MPGYSLENVDLNSYGGSRPFRLWSLVVLLFKISAPCARNCTFDQQSRASLAQPESTGIFGTKTATALGMRRNLAGV
jgi:hypothetical protein